jgi:hypothetical protein
MSDLKIIAMDQQRGKTTLATQWLMNGQKIDTYPGWSRVLVCANRAAVPSTSYMMPMGPWRKCVFSIDDLRSAMRGAIVPGTVEVGVDDADALIFAALRANVRPALVTLTGHAVLPTPSELQ